MQKEGLTRDGADRGDRGLVRDSLDSQAAKASEWLTLGPKDAGASASASLSSVWEE